MNNDRISNMGNYIINQGEVTTEELAEKFDVSIVTVRRDLKKLEEDNIITKIYGGAKAKSDKLKPFEQRESLNKNEKAHIIDIARNLIKNGDRIFIDSGTTVENLLNDLNKDIQLTVFTNNLSVIKKAADMDNISLFVVGNYYNHTSNSFTYWGRSPVLRDFNIDKAFMCTSGLTIKDGLTNKNPIEQEIKTMVCSIVDYIYLLVDDSKIGISSLMTYAKLEDIDTLVTNKKPSEEYIEFLDKNEIDLKY